MQLVFKGPSVRWADPTTQFPELKASAHYQDMYPLMCLSEEGMAQIEEKLRPLVGKLSIEEVWRDAKVVIERCVWCFFFFFFQLLLSLSSFFLSDFPLRLTHFWMDGSRLFWLHE